MTSSQRVTLSTDIVNTEFFFYIIAKIATHDMIKKKVQSGRIDLCLLFDVFGQAKQDKTRKKTNEKKATAQPAYLMISSLNAVVTSFILAYMKMKRNVFASAGCVQDMFSFRK